MRVYWRLLALIRATLAAVAAAWPRPIGRSLAFGRPFAFPLLFNPHDALAHLDLVAHIGVKVAHDSRVGGDQRVLHLHRLDHCQALARFDRLAVLDGESGEASVHRRADRGIALFRPGLGLRERIDELNERLPPGGESVHAVLGLMERDLVARLAAFVLLDRIDVGSLDEM